MNYGDMYGCGDVWGMCSLCMDYGDMYGCGDVRGMGEWGKCPCERGDPKGFSPHPKCLSERHVA